MTGCNVSSRPCFGAVDVLQRSTRKMGLGICNAVIALSALIAPAAMAARIPLDFGAFYSEPGAPVSIAPDGSSASLSEDPSLFINYLSNVPGFGDPSIIEGGVGRSLVFEYEFLEPVGNDDSFHVALLDGITGSVLDPEYEFFFDSPTTGQITFDLSGLGGISLGLQFELIAGIFDTEFGSQILLSDLALIVPDDPTDVPERGSLTLLLLGLASIGIARRSRRAMTQ